jgi:diaminohydroxyphosphoribosylaminopyrimidine deaminase/5-amino-6-(5-phosphoribosylamino)uracil reductase
MLMTGFLQPIPSCQPDVSAAVEAAAALDSSIPAPPQRPQVIAFYKPWDPYGALSNFSPHAISLPDESGALVSWNSVEHYYQVLCGKMYTLGI